MCTCATISQTSGPGCSKVGLDNSGLVRNLNSDKTVKEKFSLIRCLQSDPWLNRPKIIEKLSLKLPENMLLNKRK